MDGNTTLSTAIVNDGEHVSKPEDPVKEGYIFAGWYLESELINEFSFDTAIAKNQTLYVKWDEPISNLTITGDNQIFTLGDTNDIEITCSGELDDLTAIKVNGSVLNELYYELASGSTVLTLKNFFINIGIGVLASGIYFGIYKIVLKVLSIEASTKYNSINETAKYKSIKDMFNMIINQYKTTYDFIINPSTYYKSLSIFINIALIILLFVLFIIIFFNKKNKYSMFHKISALILLILITFVTNCTYFLANGMIHQLMIFPIYLLYIIPILVLEKSSDKNNKEFICISSITKKYISI